jgi:capsular polysaccharide export protein
MRDSLKNVCRNHGSLFLLGFSKWKYLYMGGFLGSQFNLKFVENTLEVPNDKYVFFWASKVSVEQVSELESRQCKIVLVEDGFLRSVGLGINHARPLSLVIDSRGMYYDCSKESDLEHILNFDEFDQSNLNRAQVLIKRLVELKLTKYNLKSKNQNEQACLDSIKQAKSQGKKIVLVPGQVESDASIKKGSPQITTNLDLLQCVASKVTDAFVIYKPHPDVLTQLRRGELQSAEEFYDLQITDMDMADLLEVVDEVHTMTSLTGFEALLRGKRVVCYGLPFYAGWGLTQDVLSCERRQRKLSLEELVIGALIKYPTYCDPKTGHLIDVETAVELLAQQKEKGEQGLRLHKKIFRWLRLRVFMPIGLLSKK